MATFHFCNRLQLFSFVITLATCLVSMVPVTNGDREFGSSRGQLRIGEFHLKKFGRATMEEPAEVQILIKLVRRYDILLLLGIMDNTGKAIYDLFDKITMNMAEDEDYGIIVSKRVGIVPREQFAFIYRVDKGVVMTDSCYYELGGDARVFDRAPFIVRFSLQDKESSCDETSCDKGLPALDDVALVAVFPSATDTAQEIDQLADVYSDVYEKWNIKNVLFAGNFRAGCNYVTGKQLKASRLRASSKFHWPIGDDVDTTLAKLGCAYDRFVLAGQDLKRAFIPESGKIFEYDTAFDLDRDLVEDLSDHYPIEIQIQPAGSLKDHWNLRGVESEQSLKLYDARASVSDPAHLVTTFSKTFEDYRVETLYTETGDLRKILAAKFFPDGSKLKKEIKDLQIVLHFLSPDILPRFKKAFGEEDKTLTLMLVCDVIEGGCEISISTPMV
ncbi:DNASE1L3 [Branchiostoma lanceolatum]|uniref:DNASE1L3 protein n=1 Tax=Branchiostoma lanceolatum TaxID=7740 RepID=A0A8J9Z3B0_BRALA|nr:DNASE1L3 [Branchiostoma lanceolatum]